MRASVLGANDAWPLLPTLPTSLCQGLVCAHATGYGSSLVEDTNFEMDEQKGVGSSLLQQSLQHVTALQPCDGALWLISLSIFIKLRICNELTCISVPKKMPQTLKE